MGFQVRGDGSLGQTPNLNNITRAIQSASSGHIFSRISDKKNTEWAAFINDSNLIRSNAKPNKPFRFSCDSFALKMATTLAKADKTVISQLLRKSTGGIRYLNKMLGELKNKPLSTDEITILDTLQNELKAELEQEMHGSRFEKSGKKAGLQSALKTIESIRNDPINIPKKPQKNKSARDSGVSEVPSTSTRNSVNYGILLPDQLNYGRLPADNPNPTKDVFKDAEQIAGKSLRDTLAGFNLKIDEKITKDDAIKRVDSDHSQIIFRKSQQKDDYAVTYFNANLNQTANAYVMRHNNEWVVGLTKEGSIPISEFLKSHS